MIDSPYLSLVVPAYNEEDNIPQLLKRIEQALAAITSVPQHAAVG